MNKKDTKKEKRLDKGSLIEKLFREINHWKPRNGRPFSWTKSLT